MTYYKLPPLEFITLSLIFVTFGVGVNESSVTVSVNGTRLSTTMGRLKSNTVNEIYFATHYYHEGDAMDVLCISPSANANKQVSLKYSYADALHNVFKKETLLSVYAVGFRTTLQAAHNDSTLMCKCTFYDSGRTVYKLVKVTFLLRNVMPSTANFRSKRKTAGLTNLMKIIFESSNYIWQGWQGTVPLHLNLPANKVLIIMYAGYEKELIYYEYEDGDQLSLNCSTSFEIFKINAIYFNFNGKVSRTASVSLNISLSLANNNTILQCFLYGWDDGAKRYKVWRQISVLLKMGRSRKAMKSKTKDSEMQDFKSWIIYLVACVVICLFMCCFVIIYKMMKRNSNRQRKVVNCTERDGRGSTLMKTNSSNFELHNTNSNMQYVDTHNETISSDSNSELTYAVLDLSSLDKASKDFDDERVIYAEIQKHG